MPPRPQDRFIPALSYDRLTPLYDLFVGWLLHDRVFKRRLVAQAGIGPGQRVLDLGSGTASLTILIKQAHPDADVVGLDADGKILEIARAKARSAQVAITFAQGMASVLPYPDACFDRVVSSLVFHHLSREAKLQAAREIVRVLRPGGQLHVADFGRPHTPLMFLVSLITRWFEQAADNIRGRLPAIFERAGLVDVKATAQYATTFGTVTLYSAIRATGAQRPAY